MSRKLTLRKIAREEFEQSATLYESRSPGLGQELREHLRVILQEIRLQPNRFPLRTRMTRVATIIKFHFDVCYREYVDEVVIVAIYHHARKPDGWKGRH